MSPVPEQCISKNAVSKLTSAYWLFMLYSVLIFVQRSATVAVVFRQTAVESGRRWDNMYLARVSSLSHSAIALVSSAVMLLASEGEGQVSELSKCFHFKLAVTGLLDWTMSGLLEQTGIADVSSGNRPKGIFMLSDGIR